MMAGDVTSIMGQVMEYTRIQTISSHVKTEWSDDLNKGILEKELLKNSKYKLCMSGNINYGHMV